MNAGTRFKSIAAALAVTVLGLAGCAYSPHYHSGPEGVYYGRAPAATYVRARHVNPAVYPYWSLDHFYFSGFYHPYSVFVGYREPHYYPYPGWIYGYRYGLGNRHRPYRSHGLSARYSYGYPYGYGSYGYPWYGSGRHYASFSLGFFVADGDHRHRPGRHDRRYDLRRIDERLARMQQGRDAEVSRSALLGRSGRDIARRLPRTGGAAIPRGARHDAGARGRVRILSDGERQSLTAGRDAGRRIGVEDRVRRERRGGTGLERLRGRDIVTGAAATGRAARASSMSDASTRQVLRQSRHTRSRSRDINRSALRIFSSPDRERSARSTDNAPPVTRSSLLQRSRAGYSGARTQRPATNSAANLHGRERRSVPDRSPRTERAAHDARASGRRALLGVSRRGNRR